jgi:transmembrane sensor
MDNIAGFTNKSKINQEAAQWILLLEDTPKLSKQQIIDLNKWIATSHIHKECLTEMANSWDEMDLLSAVMLPQEVRNHSSLSSFVTSLFFPLIALMSELTKSIKSRSALLKPVHAAPVVLSVMTLFAFTYLQPLTNDYLLSTEMGQQSSHLMADGSTLWLNSSTEVSVNYSEHYRRINLVKGEAHFVVAKDASRPFEVYANNRLIRAIGTAFSVHKLNDKIEVLVTEGTVELAIVENTLFVIPDDYQTVEIANIYNIPDVKNANNTPVINPAKIKTSLGTLTAGQRVSIPISNENISAIVELDNSEVTRHISWKEGKLVFAGESLEQVIKEITRHTQVKIDVLDPQLKSMRIGGQFQVGETDTLFYVLESGFGISVKKLNDHHVQLRVKEK